jgi:beta-1,4-mannosyltransferase
MSADKPIVVSIAPSHSNGNNQFVEQFTRAVQDADASVIDFRWNLKSLTQSDAIIFHWPDQILSPNGWTAFGKALVQLILLQSAKALFHTRFIWVAHNAKPHDKDKPTQTFANLFSYSLDGVIYLSSHSRQIVETLYPKLAKKPSLVTVHGHYRDTMILEPSNYPPLESVP